MHDDDPVVGELSEGAILDRILGRIGSARDALVGPGDDAAVLADRGPVVVTTDSLVHGPDFRLAWSTGFDVGWKAAAVNLADVAAMGARPTALLVALAMPDDTRMSFVESLADGLRTACDELSEGCAVVGGDLTVSSTLTIAVTAVGGLEGRPPVRRSGARAGDVLALAGDAGLAARGLAVLFDRFRDASGTPVAVDASRLDESEAAALTRQLRPTPPISAGVDAAVAGATAMIDVSDGLALDASRLAASSRVGVDIDTEMLGTDASWALTGGEDHALLAAFPSEAALPVAFREIGGVRTDDRGTVRIDGQVFTGIGGWDPYRDWDAQRG